MEKNGGSVSGKILKTQFQVCDLPEILPDASQRAKCANAQLLLPDLVVPTLVAFPETDFTIVNSKQDYVQRLFYDMTGLTYLVKPFSTQREPLPAVLLDSRPEPQKQYSTLHDTSRTVPWQT